MSSRHLPSPSQEAPERGGSIAPTGTNSVPAESGTTQAVDAIQATERLDVGNGGMGPSPRADAREGRGSTHSALSVQPRSDFASYGSLNERRRSPSTDSPSTQRDTEPDDRSPGRRSYRGRNRQDSSPNYHRPEGIVPSHPLSWPAPNPRIHSRLDRPRRRSHDNPGMFEPSPGSPYGPSPSHAAAVPLTPYGYSGHDYHGISAYPATTALPSPSPYVAPSPFSFQPNQQHRSGTESPARSFRQHGPFPAASHGQTDYTSQHPRPPYDIPPHSLPYPMIPQFMGHTNPSPRPIIPTSFSHPIVPPVIPMTRYGHEPAYVTVNPFSLNPPRVSNSSPPPTGFDPVLIVPDHSTDDASSLPPPASSRSDTLRSIWQKRLRLWQHHLKRLLIIVFVFIFIRIPHQVYLHILLRLPMLYFSRVSRLFEDANLSLPDIRRMAVANADQWKDGTPGSFLTTWIPNDAAVSPNLLNFRHSWEGFIDSLLREWKTQNVVSALMLSSVSDFVSPLLSSDQMSRAILTMLQIDAAASDPIARTTAILSLISALMSLLFGSMYIIRFGTMRKMYKAASWAEEAQKGTTSILWNVWILLAIPAVWLAWSIILFVACIMAFTWRTGATEDPVNAALSHNAAYGLRIGVSAVLAVAFVYLFLILKTLSKYGDAMDKRWNEKVISWVQEGRYPQIGAYPGAWQPSPLSRSPTRAHWRSGSERPEMRSYRSSSPIRPPSRGRRSRRGRSREIPPERSNPAESFDRPVAVVNAHDLVPFAAVKVMDLLSDSSRTHIIPSVLQDRDIMPTDWLRFTGNVEAAWNGNNRDASPFPVDVEPGFPPVIGPREWAAGVIHLWNKRFFHARSTEAILCREEPTVGLPTYAVYLIHGSVSADPGPQHGPLPSPHDYGLKSITVIQLVPDINGRHWGNELHFVADPSQRRDEDNGVKPMRRSAWTSSQPPLKHDGLSTSRMIPASLPQSSLPLRPSPTTESGRILAPSPIRPPDRMALFGVDQTLDNPISGSLSRGTSEQ
ncbi:hypothetical protein DFH06DRAFT_1307742 [Mycena polygramma]|nr:hypothetical protein DFH06DRAFT_1307742 [Mycena polygramma]